MINIISVAPLNIESRTHYKVFNSPGLTRWSTKSGIDVIRHMDICDNSNCITPMSKRRANTIRLIDLVNDISEMRLEYISDRTKSCFNVRR